MERIELWAVGNTKSETPSVRIDEVQNTETEALLEQLLVDSPDLLLSGLTLVGRQLPTAGGPLDLLGIDQDGRLVLFELKRGVLTREAVAQILDYASDLSDRDADSLARLIEQHSGKNGIAHFDDFSDWLRREYPDAPDLLEQEPRMVLVGLGVDERAKRIVRFLAESSVDIQLLTFHAFRTDAGLFLAKTTQTPPTKQDDGDAGPGTKAGNTRLLQQLAQQQEAEQLLKAVADFVDVNMPGAYRWPGKTAYTFSLPERTKEGRPTYRAYASVWVDQKRKGRVLFSLNQRAINAASDAVEIFLRAYPTARRTESQWTPLEAHVDSKSWPIASQAVKHLLDALLEGYRRRTQTGDSDAADA